MSFARRILAGPSQATATAANTSKIGTGTIAAYGTQGSVATDLSGAVNELAASSPMLSQELVWNPQSGSALVFGNTGASGVGLAARAVADSSYLAQRQRLGIATTAVAGNISHLRLLGAAGAAMVNRNQGLQFYHRMGVAAVSGTMRWFHGLLGGVAAPTNVDPAAQLNAFGIGTNGNANVWLYVNGPSGSATPVDLGASFPALTVGACYELWCSQAAAATSMFLRVRRLDVPALFTAIINTNLPDISTYLEPITWCCNNADASIVEAPFLGTRLWLPL